MSFKPAKILVHAPNWVGDHVMAFPFYLALQKLFPDSKKILLARSWVQDLLPKDVFQDVISLQKKEIPLQKLTALKKSAPDLTFTLSPSFRSALLLYLAGSKLRLGYSTRERFLLLHAGGYKKQIPPLNTHEHRALAYLRLLTPFWEEHNLAEHVFCEYLHLDMSSTVIDKDSAKLSTMLKDLPLHKYWLVAPGSADVSKVYPLKHHAQIISNILAEPRKASSLKQIKKIILVGSAKEKSQCQEILRQLPREVLVNVVDLSGQTNLKELFFLLRNALGVTANDSGIAHMAYLSDTRLITFLGMARPQETLSLAPEKIVLKKNLPCLGCMKHVCPRKDFPNQCLQEILPQEVLAAMEKILQ